MQLIRSLLLYLVVIVVTCCAFAQGVNKLPLHVDGEIIELAPSPMFSTLALKVQSRLNGEDRFTAMLYNPARNTFIRSQVFQENPTFCEWSPDARTLAIIDHSTEKTRIVLLPTTGASTTISCDAYQMTWQGHGEGLYYLTGDGLFHYDCTKRQVKLLTSREYVVGLFRVKGQACRATINLAKKQLAIEIRIIASNRRILTIPLYVQRGKQADEYVCYLSPDGCYLHLGNRRSGSAFDIVANVKDALIVMKTPRYAICADSFNFETIFSNLHWSPFAGQKEAISTNVAVNLEIGAYSTKPRHPFIASDRYITWWKKPGSYLVITERGVEPREKGFHTDDQVIPVLIGHSPLDNSPK